MLSGEIKKMADLTEAERREMRKLRRERITEESERQHRIEEQIQLLQQQRNEFILSQRLRRETGLFLRNHKHKKWISARKLFTEH